MFHLPLSLQAWNSASFKSTLKQEVCALDAKLLPLQQGLQNSSYAISDKLSMIVLDVKHDDKQIIIKAGLLYNGIIAGCSCADDPTPSDETNEYCDVEFCINRLTAETRVCLLD
jgi:hypothetical protein